MTEQRKAVIKNADMSEDMQQDAVDIASQALAKYNIEKVRVRERVMFRRRALDVHAYRDAASHFSRSRSVLSPARIPQDVAAYIKKEFDKKHNPTW